MQTILGSVNWPREPISRRKLVTLPDGDQISLEISKPENWMVHAPTVLLIHGLCGSHRSSYLVRMAKRLQSIGIRAVRMNMRGCGSGKGLAKEFYHAGRSDDVLEVLNVLKNEHPDSPITLLGYSLGANIALKLAGELQEGGSEVLNKVIAVSPPVNLLASVQMFDKPENAIYERRFSKELRDHVIELHRDSGKKTPLIVPKNLKLFEFDHLFTAPQCGFANALDYYSKCSSASYVPQIQLPCQILFAKDDPLVCHSSLDGLPLPSNVQIYKTQKGGHLGFLGNPFKKPGFRWLDSLLLEWIQLA